MMLDWTLNYLAPAVLTAAALGGLIWAVAKPHLEKFVLGLVETHAKRLEKLETGHVELDEKKLKDYHHIQTLRAQQRQSLKAQLVMLMHMRLNDDTGEMDRMIKELQATIIDS